MSGSRSTDAPRTGVLARLFAQDDWANRQVLATLAPPAVPARARAIFAHIVACEWLWLDRLHRRAARMAVWPELDPRACAAEVDALRDAWRAELAGRTAAGLDEAIDYVNSRGEPWSNRAEDVLLHVITHSAYHRGQIATLLGAAGLAPASTDFIHAIRQGFVT
jgi:uncharacterized damage-inducible protein DinB